MGNYLKMPDKRRVLALLELGWSYRRIERETGVRRETVARYDPRRKTNAANLSTGSESASDEEADSESKAANVSAGSSQAHGPPGVAEPYRTQIEAGLRQGLTAQRIYQDLCELEAYPHKYASVRRYVRRLKRQHPKLVDVMEHPPGEEAQVDFFQGPPTFDEAQGRWRRPWIFRMTLSCSKHGYEEPLWTQDRDGFLRAHEHAFVRLQGVPRVIRHDNLKAAVVRACLYDPDVSEVYAAFAQHWGFVPLPSRPRHPEENGVAERSGGYVKSNALKGRRFDSLEALAESSRTLEPHGGPGPHPRHHAPAGAAPLPRGGTTPLAAAPGRTVRRCSRSAPAACIRMATSRLTAPSTRCRTRWSASRCVRSGMATWCASTPSPQMVSVGWWRSTCACSQAATPPSLSTDRCIDQHVKRRMKPSCSAKLNTSVPRRWPGLRRSSRNGECVHTACCRD